MARVFIPFNRGRYDISDTKRYGEAVIVPFPEVYPDNDFGEFITAQRMAAHVLQKFNYGTDYLCLTGSPLAVAVCVYYLARRGGDLRLLRYDRLEKAYYVCNLCDIEEKSHGDVQGS